MKPFKSSLYVELYRHRITLSVGSSPQDGLSRLRPEFTSEHDGFAALTIEKGAHIAIIFGADRLNYDDIAHECFHAVHIITRNTLGGFTKENDEPHAYLMGYLMGWVVSELKKRGGKIASRN